ncbi:MAG: insulinase family protein [Myxococcales bacterium]|nr:insulinase family protein [Myxococcales bacterium]
MVLACLLTSIETRAETPKETPTEPAPNAGTQAEAQGEAQKAPSKQPPHAPAATTSATPAEPTPTKPAEDASPAKATGGTQPQATEEPEQESGLRVRKHTLSNGLRVVMSPDQTVPTVAIAMYYDVGSRNEKPGRSGFAHLFEHMMFQGSANVAKGEHFQLIMNRGGSVNGTTSVDRTNYYETLPSQELALGLWLEADRARSLAITQENFENQRQTVMEERRQSYDNRPYAKSMLRINELAYGDYFPYAHSTIGKMEDLRQAPLSAVQAFFNTYYAPNNAVLSIAGDFVVEEAIALVEKYFGGLASRQTPRFEAGRVNPPQAERFETMQDPLAELPAFHIAYHIPPDRSSDHYPLELMAIILGDGDSSRLYQELVKQRQVLQEIHVSTDGRRGPDLFSVWAIVASGQSAQEARSAFYRNVEHIAKKGVTVRELEKAKNRVRSAFVFGLETNLARAQRLAEFEMYWGDAKLLNSEAERYLKVTNEDIMRVAGQYFAASNRTVLDVVPAPKSLPSTQPTSIRDGYGGNHGEASEIAQREVAR